MIFFRCNSCRTLEEQQIRLRMFGVPGDVMSEIAGSFWYKLRGDLKKTWSITNLWVAKKKPGENTVGKWILVIYYFHEGKHFWGAKRSTVERQDPSDGFWSKLGIVDQVIGEDPENHAYSIHIYILAPSKGRQMVPFQGINSPSLRV